MNPGRRGFRPGVRLSVFVAVFLPLLCGLGVWQRSRAAEKQALEVVYLQQAGNLPVAASQVGMAAQQLAFKRLRLQGQFDGDRYYLIDNQIHEGTVGYWVVHWFLGTTGRAWLLNRGFVPGTGDRARLPTVPVPEGRVEIVATVWPSTGLVPLLAAEPSAANWPKLRQRLDVRAMAAERDAAVPIELRLEPGQVGALQAAPVHFVSGADRHRGYAVQWFGLATVLLLGYLAFGFRADATEDRSTDGT